MGKIVFKSDIRIDEVPPLKRAPWFRYGRAILPDQPTRYMVRTIDARWRRVYESKRFPGVLYAYENGRRIKIEINGGLNHVVDNVKRFD